MERLWIPMIVTFFSFGGLLLGGAVGLATRQLIEEKMHRLYALCGGILLGLLSLEIIPETFSNYKIMGPILGVFIGILIMSLLDNYFHHPMIHKKDQQAWQTFLFLSFAIFIHNLPSGFALGSAFINHNESAIPFLLAIVIHHIPEGLALIIPFLFTRHTYISFLLTILLLSIILGTGTIFGIMMDGKAIHLQGLIMGSAIGSLGYVTIHEMLWKAKKHLSVLPFLSWSISGFLLITIFTVFAGHH
ncbi:zinc uptake transporter [Bacillus pseudomycoides]|uniref:Zinc uptake transporter n=1 Tax=Bacillus pseudomycoides TaxID=64104 RepID=A0AA91ZRX2_9BACI|nr:MULTISPECIES: ZIP family metal transporter [Bacillus]PEB50517.1 zinc uptake transporter [Bacillus sp. AFS098217]PED81056.1 zinc uptake transporter [Bacillus pseudomycoides]PEU05487.1 zinc uptake transporter [Bacillus sp. AFS019443]PEU18079.1 zinc uptake transporter [Bacillus sp. AFS014408]PFW62247.1 zinc uptake transporter [Bacillus sp. AFS075034]